MVASLVDTVVLIDLMRGHLPAKRWFQQQTDLGVCQVVWLETLSGARNRNDQRQVLTTLPRFTKVEMVADDFEWAISRLIRYKLSHSADGNDCLIAAVSHRLQIPLYTMNLKHFTPLLESLAQKPY